MNDKVNSHNDERSAFVVSIVGDSALEHLRAASREVYELADNGKLIIGQIAFVRPKEGVAEGENQEKEEVHVLTAIGRVDRIFDYQWDGEERAKEVFAFIPLAVGLPAKDLSNIFIPVMRLDGENVKQDSGDSSFVTAATKLAKLSDLMSNVVPVNDSGNQQEQVH